MLKEVLVYGGIDSFLATNFITALQEVLENDVCVRVNSPGGSPEYGWGMIAKFSELPGKKYVKVDGKAHSMGMYFCCYADDVEALDVTEFLIHRAAYPYWVEQNPDYFTEAMRGNLERINKSLRKALEGKIDVAKFEEIMQAKPGLEGKKFSDIFSIDGQLDVFITSAEAKKIGLIDRVIKITPTKKAEIDSKMQEIVAQITEFKVAAKKEDKKTENMTKEKVKAEFPAVYSAILAAGKKIGVKKENERITACLAFSAVDDKRVMEIIKSDEPLSGTDIAEFTAKALTPEHLAKVKKDNAPAVTTVAKTPEELLAIETEKNTKVSSFETALDAQLGLGKK